MVSMRLDYIYAIDHRRLSLLKVFKWTNVWEKKKTCQNRLAIRYYKTNTVGKWARIRCVRISTPKLCAQCNAKKGQRKTTVRDEINSPVLNVNTCRVQKSDGRTVDQTCNRVFINIIIIEKQMTAFLSNCAL